MSDASVTDAATTPPADPDTLDTPNETDAGKVAPPPEPARFADFPVPDTVKQALEQMGYVSATEVQAKVVEPALAGRDLLVQSKTGSGKTSAFGVPLVSRLAPASAEARRPHALVLLPTRELAHQVAEELTRLSQFRGTRVQAIYGGVTIARQATALQRGTDIVVGTPGRLLDHIRRENLDLSAVQTVVLDEADEMLSMGFWDDVTALIRLTPPERQTLLFSATLPYEVAKSAAHLLRDAVRVDLSGDDLTVSGIDNCILHVNSGMPKPRQLLYVLESEQPSNAIIFCNTRNETEMLAKYLTQSGLLAEPISGNFKQKERERTMARIKSGELRFMVATDIAARGIDINDLTHVFNYALPEFCEVYLHRVGRTGRAGKVGRAVSLVDGRGLGTLTVLERQFGIKFVELTLPPEAQVVGARSERIMKELREKAQVAELGQHLAVAQGIVEAPQAAQLVAFLLKSYFANQARQDRAAADAEADRVEAAEDAADAAEAGEARAPRRAPQRDRAAANDPAESPRGRGGREGSASREPSERRRRGGREGRNGDGRTREPNVDRGPQGPAPRTTEVAHAAPRRGAPGAAAPAPAAPAAQAGRGRGGDTSRSRLPYEVMDADAILRLPKGGPAPDARPPSGGAYAAPEVRARPPRRATQPAISAAPREPVAVPELDEPLEPGMCRLRVNIGFDDGFKGRGAVAKKVSALAGLNDGIVTEVASRRDHAVLKAKLEVVEMVRERVDGARLGKKVLSLTVLS